MTKVKFETNIGEYNYQIKSNKINGGLKMKKYYIHKQNNLEGIDKEREERNFLELDEKQITKMVEIAGTVYVLKESIENVEEYKTESVDSDVRYMEESEAEKHYFARSELFTAEEIEYIENGGDVEYEIELEKAIVTKMEKEKVEVDVYDTLAYEFNDGSNWQIEILESDYTDTDWEDWTEEFESMKQIDLERRSTGHYTLYELPNYSKNTIIYTSYYQSNCYEVTEFIDKKFKTIEEYFDSIIPNYEIM